MTYIELSKSEDGSTVPVPTNYPLTAPSQTQVVLEKASDRFSLIIPKIGCSPGRCAGYFIFIGIFLPVLAIVTAAVASENPIWYLGTALAVISMLALPFGIVKLLFTQWTIVIEGGQLKILETFRSVTKERVWSMDAIERIESHRHAKKEHHSGRRSESKFHPACLVFIMSENTPFLDRYVQVGANNPMLEDDAIDWMAREIAHFAQKTVVIPSYPSVGNCCT